MIFVKPRALTTKEKTYEHRHEIAKGGSLLVRKRAQEGGGFVLPAGETVPEDSYWNRKIRSGDVVLASKGAAPKKKFTPAVKE